MSFDYASMQTLATELIAEFGGSVTFTHKTAGTHNATTGAITGQSTSTQVVKAAVFDYTMKESGKQAIDGETIQAGDKKMLVSSVDLTTAPALTSTVYASGQLWRIVNIKELNPAGTSLIYELQLRR
jgi:hypothetical protein